MFFLSATECKSKKAADVVINACSCQHQEAEAEDFMFKVSLGCTEQRSDSCYLPHQLESEITPGTC